MAQTDITHVECRPDVCGGAPVIRGTRFPVRSIAVYVLRQGTSPEEVVREWPHLTLAQVYGALSYYYDHQTAIDEDIEAQGERFAKARDEAE
jgi:uncharacterized protein (DUF433 family)